MSAPPAGVSTYRWSRAYIVRVVGVLSIALGLSWLAFGLLASGGRLTSGVGAVAAACTAAALLAAAWTLVRPPRLLELSASGYRIRLVRGAGVKAADWADVESVNTRTGTDRALVVVELSGSRTSIVPVALLGADAEKAQREMHERLNTAFGYRRLSEAAG